MGRIGVITHFLEGGLNEALHATSISLSTKKQEEGIPTGRHPRSPTAGEGQHTPFGHHQTSPCLCKVFERSLYNQKGVVH